MLRFTNICTVIGFFMATAQAVITPESTLGQIPAPRLVGHLASYDFDVRVDGHVLEITGSNASRDSNNNVLGDFFDIQESYGLHTETVRIGRGTFTTRYMTDLIVVRAGVERDNSGNVRVFPNNPHTDGVVLRVPVSKIDSVEMNLRGGDDVVTVVSTTMPVRIFLGSGNDYCRSNAHDTVVLSGGSGNDMLNCQNSGPATIYGGSGDDTIFGTEFNDVVFAGSGEDFVETFDGHDLIHGGTGNDEIHAGRGHDIAQGGGGADIVRGDDGIDIVVGAAFSLPSSDWPQPDRNGIIFNETELEALLVEFHSDDKAGDQLSGGGGNDFIVWHRYQDWIDFRDPFPWWVNHIFGTVWRDQN